MGTSKTLLAILESHFSHTQRVSVTSAIVVVVVVGVNFFSFSTSSLERLLDLLQIFVRMFLGWTPTMSVKSSALPLFFMELWVILCNFWPILKNLLLNR